MSRPSVIPPTGFPYTRPRRTRMAGWSRRLVQENRLSAADLIWPVFVIDGENEARPIAGLPGQARLTIDLLIVEAKRAAALGIPAIALFPAVDPSRKSDEAEEAWNPDGLMQRAIRAVKAAVPEIGLIGDVALDPYTLHGHDGIVVGDRVDNEESVTALVKMALAQAEAGIDVIAPSDMMDGRIGAIREALEENGYTETLILSYAVKYASGFYGPFRDALGVTGASYGPQGKATYQMDPANSDEALQEVAIDLSEGADWVMVKPGMPYLDVLYRVKETFAVPTFAYHVSGEYAMWKAGVAAGYIDGNRTLLETLIGFKRAGADGILTYAALEAAELLRG
ncbi:MAG: porphobilinogen synthase [Elstera sp.]